MSVCRQKFVAVRQVPKKKMTVLLLLFLFLFRLWEFLYFIFIFISSSYTRFAQKFPENQKIKKFWPYKVIIIVMKVETCKDAHRKLAITNNHTILSSRKIPAPPSGCQKYGAPVYCGCNKNQEVQFYCEDQPDVICNPCKKVKHRNCEINDLQYKITNYDSKMPNTVLTKTNTLKHRYDSMLKQRRSDLKELNGQIKDCRKEIKEFRATIGAFLDKLEVIFLQKWKKLIQNRNNILVNTFPH